MKDAYSVLGLSPNATDEEVKKRYRELAKKYHPDNYADSPLADFASEKMKEINEAYDNIMDERKKRNQNNNSGYSSNTSGGYGSYYYNNSEFKDVRSMIMNGRLDDADLILNGIPMPQRDAEWYYLKGLILLKRGWLEQAKKNLQRAVEMSPDNMEYRSAYNQVMNQRSGMFGGYNTTVKSNSGCSLCDICTCLCCADTCCECMGSDCIRCC